MAITVVRSGANEPHVFPDLAVGLEVLLFDPTEERGDAPIGERFRALDRGLQLSDVVVFRTSSNKLRPAIERDPIVGVLLADTPAFCLERSFEPGSPGPKVAALFQQGEHLPCSIRELQRAEVTSILEDTGAVIGAEGHHYLLPSGWHSEAFVRLGNATRSIPATRRLADWLLEHVNRDTALLADTGTVLPLLLEAQRHCRRYFGWKCRVDALEEYPSPASVAQSIHDLRRRYNEVPSSILFVVSVSSSGRSRNRFELAADASRSDRAVTVVETASTASESAHILHLPIAVWPPSEDGSCAGCSSPAHVQIHPASYEQMVVHDVVEHPVSPDIARRGSEFFQLLSDLDAVHLHHSTSTGVHYAVWLDTPRLLHDASLRRDFTDRIREVGAGAQLALVPSGPAVDLLVAITRDAVGLQPLVVESPHLLSQIQAHGLEGVEQIVVVDDTITTGLTLGRVRRAVYNAAQPLGINPDVSAVVLVARPSDPHHLREVGRPFRTANGLNVHHLHEVLLPAGRNCPWCEERQLLQAWLSKLSDAAAVAALARLERLSRAMAAPLLIGADGNASENVTVGSFFGELTERCAFAAASSAVVTAQHELRSRRSAAEVHVVSVEPALDAFYDADLLIGVLRTVEPLRLASTDARVSAKYRRLAALGTALPDWLRLELGWAVVNDVLPDIGIDPVLEDVDGPAGTLIRELILLRRADLI